MQVLMGRHRLIALFSLAFLAGCSVDQPLMPTPNLYAIPGVYPADEIAQSLRTNQVDLLYVTDRKPEPRKMSQPEGQLEYGNGRSDSLAYGSVVVNIEGSQTWEALVEASQTANRQHQHILRIGSLREHARFPESPYPFSVTDGTIVKDQKTQIAYEQTASQFRQELITRLTHSKQNEVVIFIHGVNNTFNSSVFDLAGLWHFSGRRGVPVVYSWPTTSGDLLGYFKDRESGEFTLFHLKEFLRLLAQTPQVERIHIIAHSRGTDVITTALRELVIETRAAGRNPLQSLRIANLILAAPDLDFDIVRQRLIAEKFGPAIGQITIYTNQSDSALNLSESLMSGIRFGRLDSKNLGPAEQQIFNQVTNVNIVNVKGEFSFLGHSYFRENPGVSSDIAILIREGAKPGDPKRPLIHRTLNFWDLPTGYPAATP